MIDSYDLFSAMSGVDEALVARSDFRVKRRSRNLFPLLAAAACIVLILAGLFSLFSKPEPATLHTPPATGISATENTEPAATDSNQPQHPKSSDIGTLHIIQLSGSEGTVSMPDFLMYIDQDNYCIAESGSVFYIYPASGSMTQRMTLSWQANTTLETAVQLQLAVLSADMETVSEPASDPLLGGILIRSKNNGNLSEIYIVDDLHQGVFIFNLIFPAEDPDGHGIRFRDMLQTFEIAAATIDAPTWMRDLRSCVTQFTAGFLKNDFSDMKDLLSDHADIHTYGADVYSKTRILQTHYKVDHDTEPTSASVSVRHKYIEDDAYDYITIELVYRDGKWQIEWATIER